MLIFLAGLILCLINNVANAMAVDTDTSQLVCRAPGSTSQPCQTSDSFTPTTEPDLDLGISNPVNILNGVKTLQEIDLPESKYGLPPFIRYYRSDNKLQNGYGIGWTSNYAIQAYPQGNKKWLIKFPDGSTFTSDNVKADQGKIKWRIGDTREFTFDSSGKLLTITKPNTLPIELNYYTDRPYQGYLQSISNGMQTIYLNYQIINDKILLRQLDTALGIFEYQYDNELLLKVIRPDGMWRSYHYEAPLQSGFKHLITGISLNDKKGNNWRARSWQYDNHARVVKAWPNQLSDQGLEFSYEQGSSTVKSKQATTKVYYKPIAGQNRINKYSLLTKSSSHNSHIVYDNNGKLQSINGLDIQRYANGNISQLSLNHDWPNLKLSYTPSGQLRSWFSEVTKQTNISYHDSGNLQGILYADGDRLDISTDAVNRPIKLHYLSNNKPAINISLGWHGQQLNKLEHPNEVEYLAYDKQQNLISRAVIRDKFTPLNYSESFAYDIDGHLIKHNLPEGGQLNFKWLGKHITNIQWQDENGASHNVINTVQNMAGYAYGNGLHMQALQGKNKSLLGLSQKDKIIWGESRNNGPNGNLTKHTYISPNNSTNKVYTYDKLNRTIGIQTAGAKKQMQWLAWSPDGQLLAKKLDQQNYTYKTQRNTSGLPVQLNDYKLEYQSQRRLHKIKRATKIIAEYAYNARGQRIYQQYENSSAHRLYVNNRLAAIWHIKDGKTNKQQRFIYAHNIAVGLIETSPNTTSKLYYIHNNQIGAPVLVTDQEQHIVWQADYDIFGRATISINKIHMPLRLPGQDEDPISGWHDNVYRTYLPQAGQYLEPDPLGPIAGQQAFGYARQQPLRHIDPLGLILLAFDGTRYNQNNLGNVWKLSQIYNDGPSFYHHGPGNSYYLDWDAVVAASSRQIQQNQWQSLMNVLDQVQTQGKTIPIDILGYSRGAALARDFANKIVANTKNGWFSYDDPLRGNIGLCINLRFLGLFDTVAQFGLLGAHNAGYDLGIAGAWQWVAHAVASHELRALFPLVSATEAANSNTIEVPFIGAHADIGGGMILDDDLLPVINGDLSDVALNWMYWQARAALVNQDDLAAADKQVNQPWLHDERSLVEKSLLSGDRNIQDANTNSLGPQGANTSIGNTQRAIFESFIKRVNEVQQGKVVGIIDMLAYDQWLQENLGMPSLSN